MSAFPFSPILASGIRFGWQQASPACLAICGLLAIISIMSCAMMANKLFLLRRAYKSNQEFLSVFRHTAHPLSIFQSAETFDFAPFFHIYYTASRELAHHLVGVDLPDRIFATRLQGAGRITPSQMEAVQLTMLRAIAEASLKFEQRMSIVAIAVTGAPVLGLLGSVWGVMDTFQNLAAFAGPVTVQNIAPGICSALLTTVVGLVVAVSSMVGYNLLVDRIRGMIVRLENFASELTSAFGRHYVDHRTPMDAIPGLDVFAPSSMSVAPIPAPRQPATM
jgi:biopolymer transport protein TolQ